MAWRPSSEAAGSDEVALEIKRVLPAAPSVVFAAFSDPNELAKWWGPSGFTTTVGRTASTSSSGASPRRRSQKTSGAHTNQARAVSLAAPQPKGDDRDAEGVEGKRVAGRGPWARGGSERGACRLHREFRDL